MTNFEEQDTNPHYTGHRERLRTRFRNTSGQGMPDYEMIELLLTLAIIRRDVKPLAKLLMQRFGSFVNVINASIEQLEAVDGMGKVAPIAIKLIKESSIRLLKGDIAGRPIIASWSSLLNYCMANMAHLSVEEIRVIFLDQQNKIIADEAQGNGTTDQAPLYIREIVRKALLFNATAIILVHNHPSGTPEPSKADIETTRSLISGLRAVGVTLYDHLIIAGSKHTSFKSRGLI